MKPQILINNLPIEELKAEILKEKNWFIRQILKPLLEAVILTIVQAVLKKFNVSPKFETRLMEDLDPDPGTTPPAP